MLTVRNDSGWRERKPSIGLLHPVKWMARSEMLVTGKEVKFHGEQAEYCLRPAKNETGHYRVCAGPNQLGTY
jgi:hypothetical protein